MTVLNNKNIFFLYVVLSLVQWYKLKVMTECGKYICVYMHFEENQSFFVCFVLGDSVWKENIELFCV